MSARDIYNNLHKVPLTPLLAVSIMVFSIFVTTNLAGSKKNLNSKAASIGGDLYFGSQQLNLQPNSSGVYDIYVTTKNGYSVSAVDFTISLDSSVATITDVSLNGVFPIQFYKDVNSTQAHVIAGVDPSSAFKGTGIVARVTVSTGANSGTANITFNSNTQLAAVGVSTNALGNAVNSVIAVAGSSATATPTSILPTGVVTATPNPGVCAGKCVGTRTVCNNVDSTAQCASGRVCCLD